MDGLTAHIHSLPCLGRAVVFQIQAHRFRCPNAACPEPRRFEKISLRLLIETFAVLKRQHNFCAAWQQSLAVSLVRVLPHTCSFLAVAPPCCAVFCAMLPVLWAFHGWKARDDFAWTGKASIWHDPSGLGNASAFSPLT
jgi:hypothetical protein